MLAVRPNQLPHEIEYMLDCAVDASTIDAGSRLVLVLYGDRDLIENLYGNVKNLRFSDHRYRIYPALRQHADELITQLDPVRQLGSVLLSMLTLRYNVTTMAKFMAQAAIEDNCEGGTLKPWRHGGWLSKWDTTPPKKLQRRLRSQRWIRNYIRTFNETGEMRDINTLILSRLSRVNKDALTPPNIHAASSVFQGDLAIQAQRLKARETRAWAAMLANTGKYAAKIAEREERKRIKRAARTACTVLSPTMVSRFVAGEPVTLAGNTVNLLVQRRAPLAYQGHGALRLEVQAHNGAHLADLCYYHTDTPVIDQLTAIELTLLAGDEDELLNSANVTGITEAGLSHPALEGRIAHHRFEEAVVATLDTVRNRRQARNDRYWQKMGKVWIDILNRQVFGRNHESGPTGFNS